MKNTDSSSSVLLTSCKMEPCPYHHKKKKGEADETGGGKGNCCCWFCLRGQGDSLSLNNRNDDDNLGAYSSSSSYQKEYQRLNQYVTWKGSSSTSKMRRTQILRRNPFSNSPTNYLSPSSSKSTSKPFRRCSSILPYHNVWWTWMISLTLILTYITCSCPLAEAAGNLVGLSGSSQKCDNEGEVFPLPQVIENPCFTCLCRGGRVECERQSCPSLQGCFLIMSGQKDGCCEVCKGCKYNNVTYPSGREVTTEGCTTTTCIAGVLTRSQVQCYTSCTHPTPPKQGQCCPTCETCSFHGKEYQDGEEAILTGDPCVRCRCVRGSMQCTKKACPVLACPASATYLQKGECCPKCNGSRTRYIPRTVCLLGDKVYPTGTTFRLDTCTNCTCIDTTAICDRISCPALECEAAYQVMTQGSCCPKCQQPENLMPKGQCRWNEQVYKNGERWDVDSCHSCVCDFGKVKCAEQMCPKNLPCPWGYKLRNVPGKCCPECVGEDGVCTVFGDPHYRSFDGRVFNFQGACKYMLTADCRGRTFSVRVRNDARESRAFSWTRTVTLKVREGRITLGQRMRIKFNGKRVSVPFNRGTLRISQDGYIATVETGVGVKLLWDGDSFLEVSVPHAMQGRLCGLCGNFNGNKTDDFMTRKGGPVSVPSAFGQSWRVGGKKACTRPEEVKGPEPICRKNWKTRIKAEKQCAAIKSSVFAPCHKTVSTDRFFKSCMLDMCECPVGRKCACEVLTAYWRSCQRSGVDIQDWRESTGCTHNHKKKWHHGFN